jgi:hypothetical protein
MKKMPCSITDGPQYDDDFTEETELNELLEDIALTESIDYFKELWENEK